MVLGDNPCGGFRHYACHCRQAPAALFRGVFSVDVELHHTGSDRILRYEAPGEVVTGQGETFLGIFLKTAGVQNGDFQDNSGLRG